MVVVIYEDEVDFWSEYENTAGAYAITLTNETSVVKTGYVSTKMQIHGGAFLHVGLTHLYTTPQDWSAETIIHLYIYGANTGLTIRIEFGDDPWVNGWRYEVTDNWMGWQIISIPNASFVIAAGAPAWNAIERVYIVYRSVNQEFSEYIDHLIKNSESGYAAAPRVGIAQRPSRLGQFPLGYARLGVYR